MSVPSTAKSGRLNEESTPCGRSHVDPRAAEGSRGKKKHKDGECNQKRAALCAAFGKIEEQGEKQAWAEMQQRHQRVREGWCQGFQQNLGKLT